MVMKKTIGNKKTLGNRPVRKIIRKNNVTNRKSELLSDIGHKLENIELEYGPIVYNELQSRLEKTIQIFNDEVEALFSSTFSTYKSKKNTNRKKKQSSKKPQYISDYEKSKKS
tara:strand:- start:51 stop:389 length:339 start_codon:yes stop_codon:yes gene_type:complete